MDYVSLGSTGLTVSAAGLGCGGASRLGQSYGESEAHSIGIVRAAIDSGVTLIDTAAYYGTEGIVGEAVRDADLVIVGLEEIVRVQGHLAAATRGIDDKLRNGIPGGVTAQALDDLNPGGHRGAQVGRALDEVALVEVVGRM